MRIMIKSADDIFESYIWDKTILRQWFDTNTDKEGNVQKEIVVYQDCFVTKADDGTFDWVLSDYSLDRDVERIDPAGWDLKQFKQNPIVLWAHDYWTPAIGKVLSPRVKDGKLIGKVQFSGDADPLAAMIEDKVKNGVISAGSVGFKSKKVEITEDDKDEDAILIHRKQILYEFSIVNIPSNQNARVQRGLDDSEDEQPKLIDTLTALQNVAVSIRVSAEQLTKVITKAGGKPGNYIEELLSGKNGDHEISELNNLFFKGNSNSREKIISGKNGGSETSEPNKLFFKDNDESNINEQGE